MKSADRFIAACKRILKDHFPTGVRLFGEELGDFRSKLDERSGGRAGKLTDDSLRTLLLHAGAFFAGKVLPLNFARSSKSVSASAIELAPAAPEPEILNRENQPSEGAEPTVENLDLAREIPESGENFEENSSEPLNEIAASADVVVRNIEDDVDASLAYVAEGPSDGHNIDGFEGGLNPDISGKIAPEPAVEPVAESAPADEASPNIDATPEAAEPAAVVETPVGPENAEQDTEQKPAVDETPESEPASEAVEPVAVDDTPVEPENAEQEPEQEPAVDEAPESEPASEAVEPIAVDETSVEPENVEQEPEQAPAVDETPDSAPASEAVAPEPVDEAPAAPENAEPESEQEPAVSDTPVEPEEEPEDEEPEGDVVSINLDWIDELQAPESTPDDETTEPEREPEQDQEQKPAVPETPVDQTTDSEPESDDQNLEPDEIAVDLDWIPDSEEQEPASEPESAAPEQPDAQREEEDDVIAIDPEWFDSIAPAEAENDDEPAPADDQEPEAKEEEPALEPVDEAVDGVEPEALADVDEAVEETPVDDAADESENDAESEPEAADDAPGADEVVDEPAGADETAPVDEAPAVDESAVLAEPESEVVDETPVVDETVEESVDDAEPEPEAADEAPAVDEVVDEPVDADETAPVDEASAVDESVEISTDDAEPEAADNAPVVDESADVAEPEKEAVDETPVVDEIVDEAVDDAESEPEASDDAPAVNDVVDEPADADETEPVDEAHAVDEIVDEAVDEVKPEPEAADDAPVVDDSADIVEPTSEAVDDAPTVDESAEEPADNIEQEVVEESPVVDQIAEEPESDMTDESPANDASMDAASATLPENAVDGVDAASSEEIRSSVDESETLNNKEDGANADNSAPVQDVDRAEDAGTLQDDSDEASEDGQTADSPEASASEESAADDGAQSEFLAKLGEFIDSILSKYKWTVAFYTEIFSREQEWLREGGINSANDLRNAIRKARPNITVAADFIAKDPQRNQPMQCLDDLFHMEWNSFRSSQNPDKASFSDILEKTYIPRSVLLSFFTKSVDFKKQGDDVVLDASLPEWKLNEGRRAARRDIKKSTRKNDGEKRQIAQARLAILNKNFKQFAAAQLEDKDAENPEEEVKNDDSPEVPVDAVPAPEPEPVDSAPAPEPAAVLAELVEPFLNAGLAPVYYLALWSNNRQALQRAGIASVKDLTELAEQTLTDCVFGNGWLDVPGSPSADELSAEERVRDLLVKTWGDEPVQKISKLQEKLCVPNSAIERTVDAYPELFSRSGRKNNKIELLRPEPAAEPVAPEQEAPAQEPVANEQEEPALEPAASAPEEPATAPVERPALDKKDPAFGFAETVARYLDAGLAPIYYAEFLKLHRNVCKKAKADTPRAVAELAARLFPNCQFETEWFDSTTGDADVAERLRALLRRAWGSKPKTKIAKVVKELCVSETVAKDVMLKFPGDFVVSGAKVELLPLAAPAPEANPEDAPVEDAVDSADQIAADAEAERKRQEKAERIENELADFLQRSVDEIFKKRAIIFYEAFFAEKKQLLKGHKCDSVETLTDVVRRRVSRVVCSDDYFEPAGAKDPGDDEKLTEKIEQEILAVWSDAPSKSLREIASNLKMIPAEFIKCVLCDSDRFEQIAVEVWRRVSRDNSRPESDAERAWAERVSREIAGRQQVVDEQKRRSEAEAVARAEKRREDERRAKEEQAARDRLANQEAQARALRNAVQERARAQAANAAVSAAAQDAELERLGQEAIDQFVEDESDLGVERLSATIPEYFAGVFAGGRQIAQYSVLFARDEGKLRELGCGSWRDLARLAQDYLGGRGYHFEDRFVKRAASSPNVLVRGEFLKIVDPGQAFSMDDFDGLILVDQETLRRGLTGFLEIEALGAGEFRRKPVGNAAQEPLVPAKPAPTQSPAKPVAAARPAASASPDAKRSFAETRGEELLRSLIREGRTVMLISALWKKNEKALEYAGFANHLEFGDFVRAFAAENGYTLDGNLLLAQNRDKHELALEEIDPLYETSNVFSVSALRKKLKYVPTQLLLATLEKYNQYFNFVGGLAGNESFIKMADVRPRPKPEPKQAPTPAPAKPPKPEPIVVKLDEPKLGSGAPAQESAPTPEPAVAPTPVRKPEPVVAAPTPKPAVAPTPARKPEPAVAAPTPEPAVAPTPARKPEPVVAAPTPNPTVAPTPARKPEPVAQASARPTPAPSPVAAPKPAPTPQPARTPDPEPVVIPISAARPAQEPEPVVVAPVVEPDPEPVPSFLTGTAPLPELDPARAAQFAEVIMRPFEKGAGIAYYSVFWERRLQRLVPYGICAFDEYRRLAAKLVPGLLFREDYCEPVGQPAATLQEKILRELRRAVPQGGGCTVDTIRMTIFVPEEVFRPVLESSPEFRKSGVLWRRANPRPVQSPATPATGVSRPRESAGAPRASRFREDGGSADDGDGGREVAKVRNMTALRSETQGTELVAVPAYEGTPYADYRRAGGYRFSDAYPPNYRDLTEPVGEPTPQEVVRSIFRGRHSVTFDELIAETRRQWGERKTYAALRGVLNVLVQTDADHFVADWNIWYDRVAYDELLDKALGKRDYMPLLDVDLTPFPESTRGKSHYLLRSHLLCFSKKFRFQNASINLGLEGAIIRNSCPLHYCDLIAIEIAKSGVPLAIADVNAWLEDHHYSKFTSQTKILPLMVTVSKLRKAWGVDSKLEPEEWDNFEPYEISGNEQNDEDSESDARDEAADLISALIDGGHEIFFFSELLARSQRTFDPADIISTGDLQSFVGERFPEFCRYNAWFGPESENSSKAERIFATYAALRESGLDPEAARAEIYAPEKEIENALPEEDDDEIGTFPIPPEPFEDEDPIFLTEELPAEVQNDSDAEPEPCVDANAWGLHFPPQRRDTFTRNVLEVLKSEYRSGLQISNLRIKRLGNEAAKLGYADVKEKCESDPEAVEVALRKADVILTSEGVDSAVMAPDGFDKALAELMEDARQNGVRVAFYETINDKLAMRVTPEFLSARMRQLAPRGGVAPLYRFETAFCLRLERDPDGSPAPAFPKRSDFKPKEEAAWLQSVVAAEIMNLWDDSASASLDQIQRRLPLVDRDLIAAALKNCDLFVENGKDEWVAVERVVVSERAIDETLTWLGWKLGGKGYVKLADIPLEGSGFDLVSDNEELTEEAIRKAFFRNLQKKRSTLRKSGKFVTDGQRVTTIDVIAEECDEYQELSWSQIKEIARSAMDVPDLSPTHILYGSYRTMVRTEREKFINKSRVTLDLHIDEIDKLIDEDMGDANYRALRDFTIFTFYPDCGAPWSEFLLGSYVDDYSRRFKLARYHPNLNNYGVVVRKDSGLDGIEDILCDAFARSNEQLNINSLKAWMETTGYSGTVAQNTLERIVTRATALRGELEN